MNKSNMATAFFLTGFILLLGVSLFLNTLLSSSTSIESFLDQDVSEGSQNRTFIDNALLIDYTGQYNGNEYETEVLYEQTIFEQFASIPTFQIRPYALYVNASAFDLFTSADAAVDDLSESLFVIAKASHFSKEETAEFILSFVQSLGGEVDPDDHVQFPYETLYEGKGDCEDMAILASRLLSRQGYDVAIIQTKDHVGLGVAGLYEGQSFSRKFATKYYYAETTGAGFTIGELPETYSFLDASVFSIDPEPFTDIIWDSYVRASDINNSKMYVLNITLQAFGGPQSTRVQMFLETKRSVNASTKSSILVNATYDISSKELISVVRQIPAVPHRFLFDVNGDLITTSWIRPG
jgi:hypothetical protein